MLCEHFTILHIFQALQNQCTPCAFSIFHHFAKGVLWGFSPFCTFFISTRIEQLKLFDMGHECRAVTNFKVMSGPKFDGSKDFKVAATPDWSLMKVWRGTVKFKEVNVTLFQVG